VSSQVAKSTDPVPGAAQLGMILFLASLAVLFAASMVGFLAVRLNAEAWPPPGMPRLPRGLWISTVLLLVSSGTIHSALQAAKTDRRDALQKGLALTSLLGVGFLICQVWVWWRLVSLDLTAQTNLYGFSFYMLTALHGLHVIGGLLPLGVTTWRARQGLYGSQEHTGVTLCAMYWHFLDVVWLVIFAFLVVVV
jgi:cytochrome c oxidase subunit 3